MRTNGCHHRFRSHWRERQRYDIASGDQTCKEPPALNPLIHSCEQLQLFPCDVHEMVAGSELVAVEIPAHVLPPFCLPFCSACGRMGLWQSGAAPSVTSRPSVGRQTSVDGLFVLKAIAMHRNSVKLRRISSRRRNPLSSDRFRSIINT